MSAARGAAQRTTGPVSAAGVLRIFPPEEGASRIVLVRHGEAECNVSRVVGGLKGCTGLTDLGRRQVAFLADRLYESGELRDATALYSSVLPRAIETAERLRPVVGPGPTALGPVMRALRPVRAPPGRVRRHGLDGGDRALRRARLGPRPEPAHRARRRELVRTSSCAPPTPSAGSSPGTRGELVVAAVHAGVIEASMIAFLGVPPEIYRRGWVRIVHASMTEWEWVPAEDRWILLRFNDSCGVPRD